MKPADVRSSIYIDFNKKVIRKILNLKLVIKEEYQNIKTFFQKVTLPQVLKNFLRLKKLKILCLDLYVYFFQK